MVPVYRILAALAAAALVTADCEDDPCIGYMKMERMIPLEDPAQAALPGHGWTFCREHLRQAGAVRTPAAIAAMCGGGETGNGDHGQISSACNCLARPTTAPKALAKRGYGPPPGQKTVVVTQTVNPCAPVSTTLSKVTASPTKPTTPTTSPTGVYACNGTPTVDCCDAPGSQDCTLRRNSGTCPAGQSPQCCTFVRTQEKFEAVQCSDATPYTPTTTTTSTCAPTPTAAQTCANGYSFTCCSAPGSGDCTIHNTPGAGTCPAGQAPQCCLDVRTQEKFDALECYNPPGPPTTTSTAPPGPTYTCTTTTPNRWVACCSPDACNPGTTVCRGVPLFTRQGTCPVGTTAQCCYETFTRNNDGTTTVQEICDSNASPISSSTPTPTPTPPTGPSYTCYTANRWVACCPGAIPSSCRSASPYFLSMGSCPPGQTVECCYEQSTQNDDGTITTHQYCDSKAVPSGSPPPPPPTTTSTSTMRL